MNEHIKIIYIILYAIMALCWVAVAMRFDRWRRNSSYENGDRDLAFLVEGMAIVLAAGDALIGLHFGGVL